MGFVGWGKAWRNGKGEGRGGKEDKPILRWLHGSLIGEVVGVLHLKGHG